MENSNEKNKSYEVIFSRLDYNNLSGPKPNSFGIHNLNGIKYEAHLGGNLAQYDYLNGKIKKIVSLAVNKLELILKNDGEYDEFSLSEEDLETFEKKTFSSVRN